MLNHELVAILTTAKAPPELAAFLTEKGLTEIDQVALLASDEDRLEDKVFPALKAGNVPTDEIQHQIAIKKSWHMCRQRMNDSKRVNTGTARDEDVLPAPTRENLVKSWQREHKFALSGERLLSEQLLKQLYNEIHASPRKLSIHLLEGLRLQSSIASGTHVALPKEIRPGEPIILEEEVADEVTSSIQCYERTRAFFSSVALISINEPD